MINKYKNCYQINNCRKVSNETNLSIVNSLRKYFTGLREYGGKFTLVGSTVESVLTAVLDVNSNNVDIAKLLAYHVHISNSVHISSVTTAV